MARTVIIEEHGGPEALKLVDREVGEPGPGEIRIAHKACGLNFIDCYQRSGLYPMNLPQALGMEASGIIEAVGDGVTHLAVGDRAAYAAVPPGAYSEARVMPAAQVCKLPDAISFEEGAAMMLKGLTRSAMAAASSGLRMKSPPGLAFCTGGQAAVSIVVLALASGGVWRRRNPLSASFAVSNLSMTAFCQTPPAEQHV